MAEDARNSENMRQFLLETSCYTLREVQTFAADKLGIECTRDKLGRLSNQLGIYRRKNVTSEEWESIKTIIKEELKSSSKFAGYRSMWQILKQNYHMHVSRHVVRAIISELEPDAVSDRQKRSLKRREYRVPGANYLWHVDGYDKLKKFGFAIHGCIDGYSRYIIWLKVGPTNNDPMVVGHYFLSAIREFQGMPKIIRADKGTENITMEKIQKSLRSSLHEDQMANTSFLYGKSCLNQRIERLWGSLREQSLQYAIEYLAAMERQGIFNTADTIHIEALRYCFTNILRRMLNKFSDLWNDHYIRRYGEHSVYGRPRVLFYSGNAMGNLYPVSEDELSLCDHLVTTVEDVSSDFADAADTICSDWPDTPMGVTIASEFQAAECKLKFLLGNIPEDI